MNDKFTLLWEGTANTRDLTDGDIDGYYPAFGDRVACGSRIRILRHEFQNLDRQAEWRDRVELVVENLERDSLGGEKWVEIDELANRDHKHLNLYLRGEVESDEEEEGYGPHINCNIIDPINGEWIASMVAGFLDCLERLKVAEAKLREATA